MCSSDLDDSVAENGQDGGFISTLLLWALENDVIDGALVSGLEGDGTTWRAEPRFVNSREGVLDTAKSRYTYSANLLAYPEAVAAELRRLSRVRLDLCVHLCHSTIGTQQRTPSLF